MIRITRKQIVFGITGTIYEMHPYHNPVKMCKIMERVNEWLDNKIDCSGRKDAEFKMFEYPTFKDFVKELRSTLMDILEFRQLNISQKLYDAGVRDLDDRRNQGFAFSSAYDKDTIDKRYSDFIDLDACVRNIASAIDSANMNSEDCFLCKYAKEYGSMEPSDCEECKTCILNPGYKFNHEYHPLSIKPKKDWTKEEIEKYNIE